MTCKLTGSDNLTIYCAYKDIQLTLKISDLFCTYHQPSRPPCPQMPNLCILCNIQFFSFDFCALNSWWWHFFEADQIVWIFSSIDLLIAFFLSFIQHIGFKARYVSNGFSRRCVSNGFSSWYVSNCFLRRYVSNCFSNLQVLPVEVFSRYHSV